MFWAEAETFVSEDSLSTVWKPTNQRCRTCAYVLNVTTAFDLFFFLYHSLKSHKVVKHVIIKSNNNGGFL